MTTATSGFRLSSSASWHIVCFAIAVFAVFHHLGTLPLLAPDEGRNAEVAREMYQTGQWLVPLYNGAPYLDKPAFYFRTVALSYDLLGVSEFSARFSSAFFALSLLAMVYAFCRHVYSRSVAATAVAVVATMPLYMAFARIVIFDMTLAFFVCGAILTGYLAEIHRDVRWYLLTAVCSGVATWVKGPVGFILPTLILLLFNAWHGTRGHLLRMFHWKHWLVFLALVLPWFIGLSLACPDFPYYGIMKESIARFTTKEFHRTQPFYFYGLIILSGCFSSCLLLPSSVMLAIRQRRHIAPPDKLLIVWCVGVILFFSLSQSKLPGYILTAVVALGILLARVFEKSWHEQPSAALKVVRQGTWALGLVSFAMAAGCFYIMANPDVFEMRLKMRSEVSHDLLPLLPNLTLTFVLLATFALMSLVRKRPRLHFMAYMLVPLLTLTVNFPLFEVHARHKTGKALASHVAALVPDNTRLVCVQCFPNGLAFYLQRTMDVVTAEGAEFTSNYIPYYLKGHPDWPENFIRPEAFAAWLAKQPRPVFVMAGPQAIDFMKVLQTAYQGPLTELEHGYLLLEIPLRGM